MKRPALIWIAFAACLAVVLFTMGWISLEAVRLEREQRQAEQRAAVEENVRLALWRMDSQLMPLIGLESAWSVEAWEAFVPVNRAVTSSYGAVDQPVLLPSPLMLSNSPFVLCYFQYGPDGQLTSPQSPLGEMNGAAIANRTLTASDVTTAAERLQQLSEFAKRDVLLAALPEQSILVQDFPVVGSEMELAAQTDISQRGGAGRGSLAGQGQMAANEFRQRANSIRNTSQSYGQLNVNQILGSQPTDVRAAPLQPLWIDNRLLLARRVTANGQARVQGVWLDWSAVRTSLLDAVRDLLPDADLVPAPAASVNEQSRLLTTLPARIVPGSLADGGPLGFSFLRRSLVIAWMCMAGAALLGAVLLRAVLSLSERRAAFVSAVTHELRTPLTTFQLYTEMLDEGLVSDEAQRADYLRTLRGESLRLGHLVENVLAYARIERSRQAIHLEQIAVRQLISRVRDRLDQHAARAGMQLVIVATLNSEAGSNSPTTNASAASAEAVVSVDVAAFERILVNLVDNACKYASTAVNRTIELRIHETPSQVEIRVRDFGPGAPGQERKRLFQLFAKSAHAAASTQPGVGLGLALSRTLARRQGGDLKLDVAIADGACFVLSLPRSGLPR